MSKVLVIEDEADYRDFLSFALSSEGHEVETAATAENALSIGRRFEPDVVVADWMLQDPVDGLEVSESLRQARPDLQIILITGYPSEELKSRARAMEVYRLFEKPFDADEVLDAVQEAARIEHQTDDTEPTPHRFRQCATCQLPLPLRRAQAHETPQRWACAMCGGRYLGVIAEDADPEHHRNVIRKDDA